MTAANSQDRIELTREVIPTADIAKQVRADSDGAIATFDGCVRNHSHGRETLYLEYEGYDAMALDKMREIASQMHERYAINRVAMLHRLGRLEIGETSVFIAVSSAHRAAAMDACRYAIDTLKKIVPIWKKEFFADGAVWADGEIPPAAVANGAMETPAVKPASK
jgi:molybdopterin synthase catalytic subunit